MYPKLYDVLHTKDKRLKERSLHAKLRREIKKGKIPEYVFNPEYEITLKKILRNGVVSHYEILIPENIVTAPLDFLTDVMEKITKFFKDHPQNKIQRILICKMEV